MRNFERVIMPHTCQTRTTWRTRNSAAISYAPILADLELNSLCVRNLMAISTRLNFLMTGTRDVLVKRLQQARSTRTASVLRATTKMAANTWTLPSNNNSTISSNGSRTTWQKIWYDTLSPGQLIQVQSIVQGTLNEAIEKAATVAAQATVLVPMELRPLLQTTRQQNSQTTGTLCLHCLLTLLLRQGQAQQ